MGESDPEGLPCRSVNPADPATIPKYVDPLPIPPVIQPRAIKGGVPRYQVVMREVRRRLHACFPGTRLWTYIGEYPGPTFDVRKDQPIVVRYPNRQQAATLWYHDHALGITRLNVAVALRALRGAPDHPGPLLQPGGSLFYPAPCVDGVEPSVLPGILFGTILVNGKVWPFLNVEPRRYRFRVLNGSNTRRYELRLAGGQPFIQIGTDGGFIAQPAPLDRLVLFPAERDDVIIDFTGLAGQRIILRNTAPDADPDTTGQVMECRVVLPLCGTDQSRIPEHLGPFEPIPPDAALVRRDITLSQRPDEFGRPMLLLEGVRWQDPVSVRPRLGTTELWRLVNVEGFPHPIHVHLVQFQLVNRQAFDVAEYFRSGRVVFTADPMPPLPDERGWKDTIRTPPGFVTRIIMRFEDFTGQYPIHCHILEHEDHDMMRPYTVVGPAPGAGVALPP